MLKISKALYDEVIAHCRSCYPKEACGQLAGPSNGEWCVVQVYPMQNTDNSPISYSMSAQEQSRLQKEMRVRGQREIGIYHSHTATEAYPSPVDVSKAWEGVSYVLVSLKDQVHPEFRSYRIDGAKVTEEPVQIDGA